MAIEDQAVRREVILAVDRDRAWAALGDARELATWLADEVELEIRPGAEGTLRWHDGEERHAVVEEVQEGRRVSLRWWEPGGEPTIVELTLDDAPGGTRLIVIELPVMALDVVGPMLPTATDVRWGPQMAAATVA
jgi:uncharacterized protein YndB with AHSA1/START domain